MIEFIEILNRSLTRNEVKWLVSSTALSLDTWHHIVYTQDDTNRSIYIDGAIFRTDPFI